MYMVYFIMMLFINNVITLNISPNEFATNPEYWSPTPSTLMPYLNVIFLIEVELSLMKEKYKINTDVRSPI